MDAHSLHVLEYEKVIARLSAHTSNEMGKEFAQQLQPLPYPETVLRRLQETREALTLREKESGMPLGGIRDIRETAERGRIRTRLSPHELLDVYNTVGAARRLRAFLMHRQDKYPLLAEMASNIPVLQLMESRIGDCVAEGGEVRDSASPELGRLRSQINISARRLNDKIQGILSSEKYRTYIQEFVVTVREGRYCVPVKAEYARAFGGLVHDSSASGATVFIEPAQTLELGNELKAARLKEEQEVDRILYELSEMVGSYYTELQSIISILGHLDVANAKAILSEEMGACEPKLNRKGIVKIFRGRHPLLSGDVVPIDIEVGDKFTTLLITGPNTGGKTVTLKTMGLLTLMTMAGMQIPASPDSEIALFEQVFADIGDEQDIQQSLSTFSAHLKNIVRIVETVGTNALILMDEIGAGTDPAEGAALAKALFDYLMGHNARVVATTHYGELKEYAYARQEVENASVEFNRETLSPTYRVLLGVPGSSNAFYIARRLGLRSQIVDEARSFLSRRELETGELLQQIEQSRKKAHQAEREANRLRAEAAALAEEYRTRVQQIADVQKSVRQQAQDEANAILRRAQEKSENIVRELQKMNKGAKKGVSVRQKLTSLRSETHTALQENNIEEEILPPVAPDHVYRTGDRVRVVSLGMEGQLLADPRDGVVAVQVGAMRATLPLEQLRPLAKEEVEAIAKREEKRSSKESTGASKIALQKAMNISPELMLLAMRVDEAQSVLEKYLDDAMAAGLTQVRIVHGKGTGALRKAVWEALSVHQGTESFRHAEPSAGGEGATVVVLKSQSAK